MAKKTIDPIKPRQDVRPTIVEPLRSRSPSGERRITTPTIGTLHVGNIHLHEAVMQVFRRYGNGPFNLEALVHLALRDLDVTPINFGRVYDRVKNYITAHFEVQQGSLLPQGQVALRSVMISFKVVEKE